MEEMEVNHVDDIHEKLTDMVGDRVKVKANMGRTRTGQVELFDPETGEHIFTPLGNQLEEH